MGKKHKIGKECLKFLVIREMQTTMRYYFVPSKMVTIKQIQNQDMDKFERSHMTGKNVT